MQMRVIFNRKFAVVVSGLNRAGTPIGMSYREFADGLCAGRSGIQRVTALGVT